MNCMRILKVVNIFNSPVTVQSENIQISSGMEGNISENVEPILNRKYIPTNLSSDDDDMITYWDIIDQYQKK